MSSAQLIVASLALPAAGALGIFLAGGRPRLRKAAALATSALLFACVLGLLPVVWAGGVPQLFVLEMLPNVALGFRVEPLGMLFALAASGLWLASTLRGGGTHHALAIAAAVGIAFAANLATLGLLCALLTTLTRPRIWLLVAALALLLPAIVATWSFAGTLEFLPGGILRGKVSGAALGGLLAFYLLGIGTWALAPQRHWLRAGAGAFAALKVTLYVFGASL